MKVAVATLGEVLERAAVIAHEIARPNAQRIDRDACWPEEAMRALQREGLAGMAAPLGTGGLGMGLLALARVCEVLGNECTSTALCFGMHTVGTAVIAAKATPDQRKRFLEPISAGAHLTTLSLSEPGSGAHFYYPQTELQRVSADEFRITGTKSFVTNGGHADSYVVSTVASEEDAPLGQFSLLLVPEGSPGMRWDEAWDGMGMRGNSSRTLHLDAVSVPAAGVLGEEGDQIWYVFEVVAPFFLMAMSGSYLGLAQAALDAAIEHLRSRGYAHSGISLGQISVLQHRIGCLWAMVERTRQLVYAAAALGDAQKPGALAALLSAKAEVSDCVTTVVNEAMTLMGGKAYGASSTMSRLLRDARAAHVMAPTTDILRTFAGRALLGLPLLLD